MSGTAGEATPSRNIVDAAVGPTSPTNSVASSNTARKYKSSHQRGHQQQQQYAHQERNFSSTPRSSNKSNNNDNNNNNRSTPRSNKKNQGRQRRNKDPSVSPSPRKQGHHQPIPQVFTSSADTFADFHSASSRAARYKVHKPGCSCSKIVSLQSRLVDDITLLANQMNRLNVTEKEDEQDNNTSSMDGLIVLPDIKLIRTMYKCCNTPLVSFDRIKDELKLRAEIFNENSGDDHQFKVSCAQCLLLEEPNGFVCVASTNKEHVVHVKELAVVHQESKQGVLHVDHAHFIAILSQEALLQHSLCRGSRSPAGKAKPAGALSSPSMIVQELQEQGILPPDEEREKAGNEANMTGLTISFGHHLKSVLGLKREGAGKESPSYWFVLGYKNPDNEWALDLPGGKRHLGETAIECAIRETEEESSLIWSDGWAETRLMAKYNKCNMYFFLKQPGSGEEAVAITSP